MNEESLREKIISESISSLREEGLRFSVDTLAARMRISKKTIYKHFASKEELARALYDTYYRDMSEQIKALAGRGSAMDVLRLYCDAKYMTRREIFNKYQLNGPISSYVETLETELWLTVVKVLSLAWDEEGTLRVILDGALEKLWETGQDPDRVLERLVRLL